MHERRSFAYVRILTQFPAYAFFSLSSEHHQSCFETRTRKSLQMRREKDKTSLVQWTLIALCLIAPLAQSDGASQGYLYVPHGKSRDDGVVLHEIQQADLPPGEYEIVAIFNDENQQPKAEERNFNANNEFDDSPFKSLPNRRPSQMTPYEGYSRPPSPFQYRPRDEEKFEHFPDRRKRVIERTIYEQPKVSSLPPSVKNKAKFPPRLNQFHPKDAPRQEYFPKQHQVKLLISRKTKLLQ